MQPRLATIVVLAALASACADEAADPLEPLPERQLVSADAWTAAAPADDLYAAMKTGRVECVAPMDYAAVDFGGYPAFEVHTDFCNYMTVTQEIAEDVFEGEHINVRMWHFDLRSPEPAEGYTAVAIEGETRWEYTVEIPADGALASYGWITDHDIPAGTPLFFHVRNHGLNSWNMIEIVAGPPPED